MRDHYSKFISRGAEIVAVGPDGTNPFQRYWENEKIPYIGLPDPEKNVLRLYKQEVNIFKLGRMPMNCIVGIDGRIRYIHFSSNMADIPDNETFLNVIDQLNASSN
jgi:peroxiredoxin Q/BCP